MQSMSPGRIWLRTIFLLVFLAWDQSVRGQQQVKGIKVTKTLPPDGKIVKRGQEVRLSCQTNQKWFFCLWRGPDGDKQCAIQESAPQSVCQNDNRILLRGGINNCDIIIRNARPEDYGAWNCLVNDVVDFESDRASINLEIGIPATVEFSPKYGDPPDNVLEVDEGTKSKVCCSVLIIQIITHSKRVQLDKDPKMLVPLDPWIKTLANAGSICARRATLALTFCAEALMSLCVYKVCLRWQVF